jgi:hypothetical protein
MYSKLVEAKIILVNCLDKLDELDYEAVEYLIDTIDYLILGKIPCNNDILRVILEDVMVCGCFCKSNSLNEVAEIISDIIKENGLCMK